MDSFKGCLGSLEAGEAVRRGLLRGRSDAEVEVLAIADGGEGTAEAMHTYLGGRFVECETHDALMRRVTGRILLCDGGKKAVVEMAQASGLARLSIGERSAMQATSYGFGELIRKGAECGAEEIICTLGGSATNDAGLGALQALGLRIYTDGGEIRRPVIGSDLADITGFDTSAMAWLGDLKISYLYDADIPFSGTEGAVGLYSAQKGASAEEMIRLERGMKNVKRLIEITSGRLMASVRSAGAAGGTGGGMACLAGALPSRGIDAVLGAAHFAQRLRDAVLVITGEGRADAQTRQGKAADGILRACRRQGVPVVLMAGEIVGEEALLSDGYVRLIGINSGYNDTLSHKMEPDVASRRLEKAALMLKGK